MDLSKLNEADQKLVKSDIESLCRYILKRREMFRNYLDECDTDPTLTEVAKASVYWSITDIAKNLSDLGFTHDALNLLRIRANVDIPRVLFILEEFLRRLVRDYPQEWTAVDVEELDKFKWKSLKDQRAWVIIKCVRDEDGHHMFKEEDSEMIKELSPNALARIFATSMKLSNVPWIKQQKEISERETNANKAKQNESKHWKDIQKRLDQLRRQGEPYTNQRELATRLGCSVSVINKAINASKTLRSWMDTREGGKKPRAIGLDELVLDKTEQAVESDPSEAVPDNEINVIMARLIEQAKPGERAKLNALGPEEQRSMAEICQKQNLDFEPSPLTDDTPGQRPCQVKQHKQV